MTSRWRALVQTLRAAGSLRAVSRWPSRCWVCGTWPSAPVCEACVADLGSPRTRCRLCALPLTRQTTTSAASQAAPHPSLLRDGHPPSLERLCPTCRTTPTPWTQCHAALDYDYPWDRCIARFKFGDQPGMARVLAELMWHAPGIAPALEQADLLVPMPLAHARLQSRGYNQAHELARELHRHLRQGPPLGARVCHLTPHVLHRLRNTDAQSALDAPTRHANLFQAFQVLPSDHRQVEGRRVVVVDDILTTGASMREATRALRQAGAHSVAAVVLARTPAVS